MPRISVNKLGAYLVTPNAARRRRIVQDQKHPSDSIVPQYRLALDPVSDFLMSGALDRAVLDEAVVLLRSSASGSPWRIRDRRNTADAIDEFAQIAGKLPHDGVRYARGPEHPRHLQIKSVDVSVRPHFLLFFQRRGVDCVGALKLHFPKGEDAALGRQGGEYVATLLYQWLLANAPANRRVMPSHCLSVDVFRRAIVQAPTANLRRSAEIADACEEIAATWARL